jgi:hypothetical protein
MLEVFPLLPVKVTMHSLPASAKAFTDELESAEAILFTLAHDIECKDPTIDSAPVFRASSWLTNFRNLPCSSNRR